MHDFSDLCIYSINHDVFISKGQVKPIITFHIPGGVMTFTDENDIAIIDRLITEGKQFSDSWEECIRYVEYMISEENAFNCRQYMQDYTV